MANLQLYLTCCALLLSHSWRTSSALPVRRDTRSLNLNLSQSPERCGQCALLFKKLLLNITELLKSDLLCFGIPFEKMEIRSTSDTVLACTPTLTQYSGCMTQRNSSFSESECLRNIVKDLSFHSSAIQSYLNSELRSSEEERDLLTPTLDLIRSLRENCSLMADGGNDSSEVHTWSSNSFTNRQDMCKMMRGFHVRTITINRAMGYISSGEHRD